MSKNNEVFHTVVIQPVLTGKTDENKLSKSSLVETVGLAKAIGLKVLTDRIINIRNPSPASLFGSGTINDFKRIISNLSPDLIIIGMTLSPIQQRNLEKFFNLLSTY